jgi:hypothetical protein
MNKKLLAAQAFFNMNASEALVSVGAVPSDDCFHFNTRVGPLHIWVNDDWIACKFDNAKAAYAHKGDEPRKQPFQRKVELVLQQRPCDPALRNGYRRLHVRASKAAYGRGRACEHLISLHPAGRG